jgi:hypothetical protein
MCADCATQCAATNQKEQHGSVCMRCSLPSSDISSKTIQVNDTLYWTTSFDESLLLALS